MKAVLCILFFFPALLHGKMTVYEDDPHCNGEWRYYGEVCGAGQESRVNCTEVLESLKEHCTSLNHSEDSGAIEEQ